MATLQSTLRLTLQDRVSQRARGISAMMDRLRGQSRAFGRPAVSDGFGRLAGRLVALGGAYVGLSQAYRGTIGAAMDFESSMAEVKKVVDTTPKGFAELSRQVSDMSKRLPVATSGLAEIMASAAQAGVAVKDLGRFTEFTAKAGIAFDMASGDVGEKFAKLRNNFSLTQEGVEGVANAMNFLSNRMAAKASEITDFTVRAAGAASALRLSAEELSAVGSALIASGVAPETAARGMNALANSLSVPDKNTYRAFKAMGISFKEWRKIRDKNGPEAMRQLFEALNKMNPDAAMGAIANLVGKDFSDDFSKLVNNPALLSEAFRLVANEAAYAGSVQSEYASRAETAANKIAILGNNLKAVGRELGGLAAGPIGDWAKDLADALRGGTPNKTIFDKIGAAYTGFTQGIGGTNSDPFKALKDGARDVRRLLFGTPITDDMTLNQIRNIEKRDERTIGGITRQFRELGRSIREIADGDVTSGLNRLSQAVSDFSGSISTFGALGGLLALSAGLKALRLAFGLGFALWGPLRLLALAAAISTLANAVKEVGSLDDFVEAMKGLEAVDWMKISAGLLLLVGPLRTLRWLWAGGKVLGRTIRGGRGSGKEVPPKPTGGNVPRRRPTSPWNNLRKGETSPQHRGNAAPGQVPKVGTRPIKPSWRTKFGGVLGGLMNSPAGLAAEGAFWLALTSGSVMESKSGQMLVDRLLQPYRDAGAKIGRQIGERFSAPVPSARPGRFDGAFGAVGNGDAGTASALDAFLERMSSGPQEVTGGPVTTQPSGVQDVNMINPPPRPDIKVSATFHIHEAQNPDAFWRDAQRRVTDMVSGVQADLEATPGY